MWSRGRTAGPSCTPGRAMPLSAASWTSPSRVLTSGCRDAASDADGRGRQTYPSLVCDEDDVLHLVSRQKRRNVDAMFGGQRVRGARLPAEGDGREVDAPRRLVVAPTGPATRTTTRSSASTGCGRLFLSLSIWRLNGPVATRCAIAASAAAWCWCRTTCRRGAFATTADFVAGIDRHLISSTSSPANARATRLTTSGPVPRVNDVLKKNSDHEGEWRWQSSARAGRSEAGRPPASAVATAAVRRPATRSCARRARSSSSKEPTT